VPGDDLFQAAVDGDPGARDAAARAAVLDQGFHMGLGDEVHALVVGGLEQPRHQRVAVDQMHGPSVAQAVPREAEQPAPDVQGGSG
jgi:hypothetical protein